MQLQEPMCRIRECVHFQGVYEFGENVHRPVCKAFPQGIPVEIAYGPNPHTSPYLGDSGILYAKKK